MVERTTFFAPAERAAPEAVERLHRKLSDGCAELDVISALPVMTLALNAQRQAVFASREFLRFLGDLPLEQVLGRRPGELLGCVHAGAGPAGCGTSTFCRFCGAARAVVDALNGTAGVEECRMVRTVEGEREAVELRVWATPIRFEDEQVTLFTILDVSDEKRRTLLERIFFHDVLNTAGAIRSMAEFLSEEDFTADEEAELKDALHGATDRLIAEIKAQRMLAQAEAGILTPEPQGLDLAALASEVAREYEKHPVAEGISLRVDPGADAALLRTDKTLAGRVIGNLVKNALEASVAGDVVTVRVRPTDDGAEVAVYNPAVMSAEVRSLVFHRSFSTKGGDRGLGTWSVKLLVERYLGGTVEFTSEDGSGTTFHVRLPRSIK